MVSTSYYFSLIRGKAYKTNFLIILSGTWLHIAIYATIAPGVFLKFLQSPLSKTKRNKKTPKHWQNEINYPSCKFRVKNLGSGESGNWAGMLRGRPCLWTSPHRACSYVSDICYSLLCGPFFFLFFPTNIWRSYLEFFIHWTCIISGNNLVSWVLEESI